MDSPDSVSQHYGVSGLCDTILEALRAQGKDTRELTIDDLAPIDEFHIRGRQATVEMAALAGVESDWEVLDVGSGLGGTARFLASEFGCRVRGVDLTPEYCDAATTLSRLVGLDGLTEFHCASALNTPFPGQTFDLVCTQHVQMNLADKPALYREIRRVLRPGGRFVFHDILAGPGGTPHFPVHWANEAALSFLISDSELRCLLEETGLQILEWTDTTAIARDWYFARLEERRQNGAPPLGLHVLMGENAPAKFENVARNLTEDRIAVFQGLLERTE